MARLRRWVSVAVAVGLLAILGVLLWWFWPPERERPWLVLCYVCADEADFSEPFFLDELRREVLPAGVGSEARTVLLVDRHFDDTAGPNATDADAAAIDGESAPYDSRPARLYLVKSDGALAEQEASWLSTTADADMGATETLQSFVHDAVGRWGENRSVALVVCGHGSGTQFVCEDAGAGGTRLELERLRTALDRADRRLELVVYYACSMATMETCRSTPHTRLLVASQEVVDAVMGLDLSVLSRLSSSPRPSEFPPQLTEAYFAASPAPEGDEPPVADLKTLSTTRLPARTLLERSPPTLAAVNAAFDELCSLLKRRLDDDSARRTTREAVLAAAAAAESFGADPNFTGSARVVDLSDFATQLRGRLGDAGDVCRRIVDGIADACDSQAGRLHPRAHGLSVLLPGELQPGDEQEYRDLGVCSAWLDVLIALRPRDDETEPALYAAEVASSDDERAEKESWESSWSGRTPSGAWFAVHAAATAPYATVVPLRRAAGSASTTWNGRVPWTWSGTSKALFAFTGVRSIDAAGGVVVAVAPAVCERAGRAQPIEVALEWELTLSPDSLTPASARFLRCVAQAPSRGARYEFRLRAGDRLRPVLPSRLRASGAWSPGAVSTAPPLVVSPKGAASLRLEPGALPRGSWRGGVLFSFAPAQAVVRRSGVVVPPKAQGQH
ncbi:MAG: hypothetical protein IT460_11390 [Planctomycetes bacterium]|nr:hypothetical protein [Planctomycetota bacterium]